ncbi:MAG: hypothetical protein CL558_12990 [Alphaproteobacteria bacterium]|nr:hypothetical protein [Alphaproteobacteria bacterium]MAX94527.1 hypothetical protein [Alphaproteobacteria bacterium]MAX97092.1 hypothetical protein [Alphaproteobacteria bacterium]MBN54479.1 hypothetical protein [Alphaproteobacteria bacterium]OUT41972.1 MAG: hypothetical protein CBB62_06595 [Micavibrio sp. TMED2]
MWPDVGLGYPAQSEDATEASTQGLFVFDATLPVSVIALINHNLTNDAVWKATFYSDAAGTVPVNATDDTEAWGIVKPYGTAPWGTPEWWGGKPGPETRAAFVPTTIATLSGLTLARSFRLEISDTGNPDGRVRIGHIEVAQQWRSSKNFDYGNNLGFRNRALETEAAGGAIYGEKRRNPRTFQGVIRNLPRDEAFGQALDMQRQLGTVDPVLVQINPDDVVNRQRLTMLARLRDVTGVSQSFFNKHDFPFTIEEVL